MDLDPWLTGLGGASPRHSVVSDVPAATWEQAMVAGNGVQGAMAMGWAPEETIILNHAGLFLPLAAPFPTVNQVRILPELRRMIEAGEFQKAADRIFEYGKEEGKDGDTWTDPFVPACSLRVNSPARGAVRGYRRGTDFDTGVVATRWEDDAGEQVRRMFVSRPDNLVVLSLTCAGVVDCALDLCLHDPRVKRAAPPPDEAIRETSARAEAGAGGGWLSFRVAYARRWPGSLQGCEVAARVIAPGGRATAADGVLRVSGSREVLVLLRATLSRDIGRSGQEEVRAALGRADTRWDELLRRHAAVHGEIMGRCRLELGGSEADHGRTAAALFAGSRIGAVHPALLEKEFDACRYLVLSSSGPDFPPNLQGIWGATWAPPWSGDYTQNGNLQTAVAAGLAANLPETMEGYFRYLESQLPDYQDNARRLFGARGPHIPHRTSTHGLNNRWVPSFPMTFWTAGAAWHAQFFHEYWLATGDENFLFAHALPWMKECAAFYEDFFYEGPDGTWVSNPSYSPENEASNTLSQAALDSTMDFAAARELLNNLVDVCERRGIEAESVARWKALREKIPAYRVNADGAVAEWITPLLDDSYDHRHASHLYALYAGLPADIAADARLQAAFRTAIEKRMEWRRANNGAEMAFGLCQLGWAAASLRDTPHAAEIVDWLASNFWFPESLVTAHNFRSIFNIDLAGGLPRLLIQMLVQAEPGRVDLLPALPAAWPAGRITGVLCRGRIEVRELEWQPGEVTATLRSAVEQRVAVSVCGGESRTLELPRGRDVAVRLRRAPGGEADAH